MIKVRRYTAEMTEKCLSFWRHSLENSQKLEFYTTFKDEYSKSDYLYQLRHYDERQNFVKFNISNHKLMIAHGQYQKQEGILYARASIWAIEVPQKDHRGIFCELFTFSTSICRLFFWSWMTCIGCYVPQTCSLWYRGISRMKVSLL